MKFSCGDPAGEKKQLVTVEVILSRSSGSDDRVSDTRALDGGAAAHLLSGTLELMRTSEEPVQREPEAATGSPHSVCNYPYEEGDRR
jgi:hypothetical protein